MSCAERLGLEVCATKRLIFIIFWEPLDGAKEDDVCIQICFVGVAS